MAKVAQFDVENVLSKFKKLEDAIKSGIDATQEIALDCEDNDAGCTEIGELKNVMLDFVSMSRDIKQWGTAARQTVAEFRKSYDPTQSKATNIEEMFNHHLEKEQSSNKLEDLEKHRVLMDFRENVWNIHHADEQLIDEEVDQDDSILIGKKTGNRLICPITKTEMKNPVKSKTCGHSYDKDAIEQHIRRMKSKARCPFVGCSSSVRMDDLAVDIILTRELSKKH